MKNLKNFSSLYRVIYPFNPPVDPHLKKKIENKLFLKLQLGDIVAEYYARFGWAIVKLVHSKGVWFSDEGQYDSMNIREKIKKIKDLQIKNG